MRSAPPSAPMRTEPLVRPEPRDQRRPLVQVVDAVADVDAVDRCPPRALVVGSGRCDALRHVGRAAVELGCVRPRLSGGGTPPYRGTRPSLLVRVLQSEAARSGRADRPPASTTGEDRRGRRAAGRRTRRGAPAPSGQATRSHLSGTSSGRRRRGRSRSVAPRRTSTSRRSRARRPCEPRRSPGSDGDGSSAVRRRVWGRTCRTCRRGGGSRLGRTAGISRRRQ